MKYIVENNYNGECFIADSLEEALNEIHYMLEVGIAEPDDLFLYSAEPIAINIETTPRITLVDSAE